MQFNASIVTKSIHFFLKNITHLKVLNCSIYLNSVHLFIKITKVSFLEKVKQLIKKWMLLRHVQ